MGWEGLCAWANTSREAKRVSGGKGVARRGEEEMLSSTLSSEEEVLMCIL